LGSNLNKNTTENISIVRYIDKRIPSAGVSIP